MTKKDLQSLLLNLESLEESDMGQLQGGFASLSVQSSNRMVDARNDYCTITNNCDGGNCVVNCGKKM
ncbi:MAG: hypothetical protein IT262_22615 [Saprospiraceae bacterium]|nr:hypothetical protein [Saprospiraceae bacterium]